MKLNLVLVLSAAAILYALPGAELAASNPPPTPPDDLCGDCPLDTYKAWYEIPTTRFKKCDNSPPSAPIPPVLPPPYMCLNLDIAPDPIMIECNSYLGPQVSCEAWPRGTGITYTWAMPVGLELVSGGGSNPNATVNCTHFGQFPGIITLTVTSPLGLSAITNLEIGCGAPNF